MIVATQYLNEDKHRYELKIENLYCGVLLYHLVKYDNKISEEFIKLINETLEYYFHYETTLTLEQVQEIVKNACKKYNVINLKIERG